jgi:hypothetical protein
MKNRNRIILLTVLAITLVFVSSVLAMSSPNFQLDWFTPMTSSSGGEVSSTNYAADVTVGQTAIGPIGSANYHASLGYWFGQSLVRIVHLPLIQR